MQIDLPFPHKCLWPNGKAHWGTVSVQTKKHRFWAKTATQEAMQHPSGLKVGAVPSRIKIIVYPKSRGPAPDKDNCIAACKAMLDGIADALGVNDRYFDAPTVEIASAREGRFVVEVTP